MFEAIPDFGAQFLYSIDRSLQFFFSTVQDVKHIDDLSPWEMDYLVTTATELMDGIRASRAPSNILLPPCLRAPAPDPKRGPAQNPNPQNSNKKPKPDESKLTNPNPNTQWLLPKNRGYADFFKSKSENLRGWPNFPVHNVPRPMCVKYHTLGLYRSSAADTR